MSILLTVLCQSVPAEDGLVGMNPDVIQMNGYVHKELSPEMLLRVKSTTDTFEIIDGISFEQAVDLYKRDFDPESNLVIWEEMARVYNVFCESRCSSAEERKDVYRALLLRSMFPDHEALARLNLQVISKSEARALISRYRLQAKPIDVIEK
ncbi:MAG: hypothetical protein P8166_06515 [Candidatus Thiodiazotropha sp.]